MKRFTTIIFSVIFMLMLIPSAAYALSAPSSEPSTLTIIMEYGNKPLDGIKIAICRVADAKEVPGGIVYDAAPSFAGAGADFTNLTEEKNIALAASLDAYASAHNIARSQNVTGSDGKAIFTDFSAGLYLVAQLEVDTSEYIIAPYLVAVPGINEQTKNWDYNVIAYPKTEPVKRDTGNISIGVHKIWVGTNNPPSSILVQLYKNGQPNGNTVTLNSGNYWSYTWSGLDSAGTWTVDELNVPAGFTKDVSGSVSTGFIITNTKTTDIPDEPPPKAPPDVPKTPPDGPKTNDNSNPQLWIMLIAFGCTGLFSVICAANSKRISRILKRR